MRRFEDARVSWVAAISAFTDSGDDESAALVKVWLTALDGEDPSR